VVNRLKVSKDLGRRIPIYVSLSIVTVACALLSKAQPWPWISILIGMNALMTVGVLAALNVEVRGFKTLLDDIEKVRIGARLD
jgi:hypothetical protein